MTGPSAAGPPVQPDEPSARGPRHAAARRLLRPPLLRTPLLKPRQDSTEPQAEAGTEARTKARSAARTEAGSWTETGTEVRPVADAELPRYQPGSYRPLPYRPAPPELPQYGSAQQGLTQHGRLQQGPLQHGLAQHGPVQHGPVQHGPVQGPAQHESAGGPARPPLDRWFSSEQAMGLAAAVLIVLVTVMSWATAWSDWNSYAALKAYLDNGEQDPEQLDRADLISGSLGIVAALALFAAAAVFIVWLWRVRWNAEMFCRGEHRFTRGWVLGSWICPVVNLWYPKWVVDDIVAASDPQTPPQTVNLREIPGTRLVWAWWITWVIGLVLDNVAQRSVLDGVAQLGELRGNAILASISAVSTTAAAVFAILLIQRVNDLQTQRPWTPWWAAGQPEPPFRSPAR